MSAGGLVRQILEDDRLTRGLGDPEAKMLIEWIVERVEVLELAGNDGGAAVREAGELGRRGRAMGRFVWLWCHARQRGAAIQLAASEHSDWPLPDQVDIDPCELMATVLHWEESEKETGRIAA